jgi:hypothetical protein
MQNWDWHENLVYAEDLAYMSSRHLIFQPGYVSKALQTSSGTVGGFLCLHGCLKAVCAIPKTSNPLARRCDVLFDIMHLSHDNTEFGTDSLSEECFEGQQGSHKIAALKEAYNLVIFTLDAGDIL